MAGMDASSGVNDIMPITVSWDDEAQTITRVFFEGKFTFDDVFEAWQQEIALLQGVDHPTYSLNVFGRIPMSAAGFDVRRVRDFAKMVPAENLQLTVQVSDNMAVRGLLQVLALPLPNGVQVVTTEAEAYAIINAHKAQFQGEDH
jgi:hypothetical protein